MSKTLRVLDPKMRLAVFAELLRAMSAAGQTPSQTFLGPCDTLGWTLLTAALVEKAELPTITLEEARQLAVSFPFSAASIFHGFQPAPEAVQHGTAAKIYEAAFLQPRQVEWLTAEPGSRLKLRHHTRR